MENLFLSLTTQMKKISKSQNDMTTGRGLLTTNYERSLGRQNERRSQSDTAINLTKQIESSPNLLQLINQENLKTSTNITWRGKEDGSSSPTHSTVFLGGRKHGSLLSLNSTCTEAGNFEKADVTGEIEFAIRYIFKTRTLEVCIKACKNLAYGEEKKKKCNPYVKAYLLPDKSSQGKRKTSVKKNTVDPAFHETLKYLVDHAQLVTRLLQISVWHRGTLTRRVFLGEVLVPLTSWNFEDHTTQAFRWYQLKAKRRNQLTDQTTLLTIESGKKYLPAPIRVDRYYCYTALNQGLHLFHAAKGPLEKKKGSSSYLTEGRGGASSLPEPVGDSSSPKPTIIKWKHPSSAPFRLPNVSLGKTYYGRSILPMIYLIYICSNLIS
uniref:C2 domain-containing protein n=1 Tax=Ornithorhynchus anatinus TaxID=9258 RepID=A0A6I8N106_ORNAN